MGLEALQPWLSLSGLGPLAIVVVLVLTGRLITKPQVDREQAVMLAEIDRQASTNEKLITANEKFSDMLPAISESMKTQEHLLQGIQEQGNEES